MNHGSINPTMALVPEHDKCAGYSNVESIISECIDQGKTHMQKDR